MSSTTKLVATHPTSTIVNQAANLFNVEELMIKRAIENPLSTFSYAWDFNMNRRTKTIRPSFS